MKDKTEISFGGSRMKRLTYLLCLLLPISALTGCPGQTYTTPTVPYPAPNPGSDPGLQTWLEGELIGTPTLGNAVQSVNNLPTPIPQKVLTTATSITPFVLIASAYDGVVGVQSLQLKVTKGVCNQDGSGPGAGGTTVADSIIIQPSSAYPTSLALQYIPNVAQDMGSFAEIDYQFSVMATTAYGKPTYSQPLYYIFTANGKVPSGGCAGGPFRAL
jgi:hypothetical protein